MQMPHVRKSKSTEQDFWLLAFLGYEYLPNALGLKSLEYTDVWSSLLEHKKQISIQVGTLGEIFEKINSSILIDFVINCRHWPTLFHWF